MTDSRNTPQRLRTLLDRDGFVMVYRGEEVGAVLREGTGFSFVLGNPFQGAEPTYTYAALNDVIEDGWKVP